MNTNTDRRSATIEIVGLDGTGARYRTDLADLCEHREDRASSLAMLQTLARSAACVLALYATYDGRGEGNQRNADLVRLANEALSSETTRVEHALGTEPSDTRVHNFEVVSIDGNECGAMLSRVRSVPGGVGTGTDTNEKEDRGNGAVFVAVRGVRTDSDARKLADAVLETSKSKDAARGLRIFLARRPNVDAIDECMAAGECVTFCGHSLGGTVVDSLNAYLYALAGRLRRGPRDDGTRGRFFERLARYPRKAFVSFNRVAPLEEALRSMDVDNGSADRSRRRFSRWDVVSPHDVASLGVSPSMDGTVVIVDAGVHASSSLGDAWRAHGLRHLFEALLLFATERCAGRGPDPEEGCITKGPTKQARKRT